MKKVIKKSMAVFLTLLMLVSCFSFAMSAFAGADSVPIIRVSGIASYDIVAQDGTMIFPSDLSLLTDELKPALEKALADPSVYEGDVLINTFTKLAEEIFLPAACDESGNPINGAVYWQYPIISRTNHSGTYDFQYDWRLDPCENAEKLKDFVDYVCKMSGHDRVDFLAFSLGSTIFNAYCELYSEQLKHIRNVVYLCPGCNGVDIVQEAFAKKIKLNPKAIVNYFDSDIRKVENGNFYSLCAELLSETGVMDSLTIPLQSYVDANIEKVYEEVLFPVFVMTPSIWALLPDDVYESAKQMYLAGQEEKYAAFIQKIDFYHYNVQVKTEDLLKTLYDKKDTHVNVIAKYNMPNIPIYENYALLSDGIIDTYHSSFGATCVPYQSRFSEDYQQGNTSCGHDHISPDRMVDASTCLLPEVTWFIRDFGHSHNPSSVRNFCIKLLTSDEQFTVNTDLQNYPQFLKADGEKIVPLTAENSKNEKVGSIQKYSLFTKLFLKIRTNVLRILNRIFSRLHF